MKNAKFSCNGEEFARLPENHVGLRPAYICILRHFSNAICNSKSQTSDDYAIRARSTWARKGSTKKQSPKHYILSRSVSGRKPKRIANACILESLCFMPPSQIQKHQINSKRHLQIVISPSNPMKHPFHIWFWRGTLGRPSWNPHWSLQTTHSHTYSTWLSLQSTCICISEEKGRRRTSKGLTVAALARLWEGNACYCKGPCHAASNARSGKQPDAPCLANI